MTTLDNEGSAASSEPVELFQFTGTYNEYFLCSREGGFVNSTATWEEAVITRGGIQETAQEEQDNDLTIELQQDHPLITEYVYNEAPPDLELKLYRAQVEFPDTPLLLWQGEVLGWSVKGETASAKVPSYLAHVLERTFPPINYQFPCNHVLGDAYCGVDMTLPENSEMGVIDTISENVITMVALPTIVDNACRAGKLYNAAGENRMIIDNVGRDFTISSPFTTQVQPGDTMTFERGCDHSYFGDCGSKFNNRSKCVCFPLVPDRNPFGGRL